MTTLLLIRHGENNLVGKRLPGRMPGVHLNERGLKQAEALVPALQKAPLKAIYSSPLERARETAEPLARALGLEVQLVPDLADVEVGEWAGRTLKSVRRLKVWKVVQGQPSAFRFPGGESFIEAQARAVEALNAIAARHPEELVACFTHADVVRLVTAHYLGMSLDSFQRLGADTTSITVVHIGKEGQVSVPRINQVLGFEWPEEKPKKGAKTAKAEKGQA
jgi:probable phosphomutase (TIGR03848 family)